MNGYGTSSLMSAPWSRRSWIDDTSPNAAALIIAGSLVYEILVVKKNKLKHESESNEKIEFAKKIYAVRLYPGVR